jgi:hypothetical protein
VSQVEATLAKWPGEIDEPNPAIVDENIARAEVAMAIDHRARRHQHLISQTQHQPLETLDRGR